MEKEKLFTHLFPLCSIVFLGCLQVGISLGVLPSYVHQHLHFDNLLVGVVIGIESVATLATRHFSGSLADARGSRITVIRGIGLSAFSGVFYLLSYLFSGQAVRSLVSLIAGRILLGCGESLLITGALSWGIGLLGHQRSGKTMAWVGIAIYGAIACGAPLGLFLRDHSGYWGCFGAVTLLPLLGLLFLIPLQTVPASGATRLPFYKVIGLVGRPGAGLALATVGFGGIASFISLYFTEKGWAGTSLALTIFGAAYILTRLFFAHLPDKLGGARVAFISLLVEALGQLLLWKSGSSFIALMGAALTGFGFSLVFPSFGVEAVKRLPPQQKGIALGAYVAFFDLALGVTAPAAGFIAGHFGYAQIYCFGALATGISALLALSLKDVRQTVS